MTDWKKIIVGDAFRLNSRNPRYYADLALMWPTVLFGTMFIRAIWFWSPATSDASEVLLWGGLLALNIVLIKERGAILIGCLGVIAAQALWGVNLHPEESSVALSFIAGSLGGAFVLYWAIRSQDTAYGSKERIRGLDMLGLLCGTAGLGLAILILIWVRR